MLSKSIHINHIKHRHIIPLSLYFQTLVTYLMCSYNSIHAAKHKCRRYSRKVSFFQDHWKLFSPMQQSRTLHYFINSYGPAGYSNSAAGTQSLEKRKTDRHSPIKSTVCPVLLSTDTKLLPPEVPDFTGLPLEASKVMV